MFSDYHVHTPLCRHAVGEPAEYIAIARERGLDEIGFSDHCPMDGPEPFDDWRMSRADLPRYLALIEEARAAAAPFPVRLGLECDYVAGHEGWIEELSGMADWDYLIGSVHYIPPGWDVDHPKYVARYQASPAAVAEIWTAYWREYTRMAASGLFDFLAHPDLPKKFGYRPTGDLRRFYQPAIAAAAKSGVAFEISTAGLRKPVGELYPAQDFLVLAREAGLEIAINSDAHAPGEIGQDFAAAAHAARAAGFTQTLRFKGRQRSRVAIPKIELKAVPSIC